ncbi:YCF48-related protein [Pseudomonas citronellolis]|uniref:YCF48-related protein n=1 Tax=Pseudomonas citronellolis TaxID=53408 RepID=UPI0021BF8684|nr:YCF48-related protein [Pseudomonas citronellolis]UXJ50230.1 YCF48-related protein [Pseudomonas citronellolis]
MNSVLKTLTFCIGAWGCIFPAFAFIDPLEQPAMLSERAQVTPLYGIAGGGQLPVVTVGPRGHILRSEDAGRHFTQSESPLSSDLIAVYFVNPAQGWAVGHDGVILHSADGGKTWQRQLDGRQLGDLAIEHYANIVDDGSDSLERARHYAQTLKHDGPTKPLLDVYFENEREGWAIGAFNLILHTNDGGVHWKPWMERTENPNEYSLHAIRKIGEDVFIAGELGLLLRLDRAQQRFARVDLPYDGSLFGLTGRHGLLVVFGLRGNAWASRDDGGTWQRLDTRTNNSINAGTTLADGRFVLASTAGELLFSDREGKRIIDKTANTRAPLYGLIQTDAGLVTIGPAGVQVDSRPLP